jgi:hypothetical protein
MRGKWASDMHRSETDRLKLLCQGRSAPWDTDAVSPPEEKRYRHRSLTCVGKITGPHYFSTLLSLPIHKLWQEARNGHKELFTLFTCRTPLRSLSRLSRVYSFLHAFLHTCSLQIDLRPCFIPYSLLSLQIIKCFVNKHAFSRIKFCAGHRSRRVARLRQ